jgi:hypothetical protein
MTSKGSWNHWSLQPQSGEIGVTMLDSRQEVEGSPMMETTHLPLMRHRSCNDDSSDTINIVIGGLVKSPCFHQH